MAFQTSSGSSRERWIAALLPAAVILMVYVVLINFSRGREIKKLREELASRQKNAVTEDSLATAFAQKMSVASERDKVSQQIEVTNANIGASLAQFTGGSATERMMQVNQLCRENSVGLLLQKATSDVEISSVRQNGLRTLQKRVPKEAVTFRQLDLVGRYGDVESLLKRLPESIDGVVVLKVELLENRNSADDTGLGPGQRMWRVYVLM